MTDYLKGFELACYPNKKPLPDNRVVCGVQKGDTFDPKFKGYTPYAGGSAIGKAATLDDAWTMLRLYLRKRLTDRIAYAVKQQEYYAEQLATLDATMAAASPSVPTEER